MLTAQTMDTALNIPIPHYPPFKLRSSLTDKDPVIWVHLLEGYIRLIQLLTCPDVPHLLVKSVQQLQLFVKLYLSETSRESTQIFSLGAINPEITANGRTLRAFMWHLLKSYSFVKLNIDGQCAWDICRVYGAGNASAVRVLIDGTFVSPMNDNKKSGRISSIGVVQRHLESLIENDKFSNDDLTCLLRLLGQQVSEKSITTNITAPNARSRTINKKSGLALSFAEKFVDSAWIEILEKISAGGRGRAAPVAKNVMIVSLLLLRAPGVLQLVLELAVYKANDLLKYPLMGSIIVSSVYREMIPRLEERLLFLAKATPSPTSYQANPQDISLLSDMFPELDQAQLNQVLGDVDGNVETATNMIIENGGQVQLRKPVPVQKREPAVHIRKGHNKRNEAVAKRSIYDDDEMSRDNYKGAQITFGKKKFEVGEASLEAKQQALTAALRLLYESDEDEPDDSYADQEKTSGDGDGRTSSAVDDNERKMFSEFKRGGASAFDKRARKLPERAALREAIKALDEQIEGWYRILTRLARRFKILEEDYFFNGRQALNLKKSKRETRGLRQAKIEEIIEESGSTNRDIADARKHQTSLQTIKKSGGSEGSNQANSLESNNGKNPLKTNKDASRNTAEKKPNKDSNQDLNDKTTTDSKTKPRKTTSDQAKRDNSKKEKEKGSRLNHSRRQGNQTKNRDVTLGMDQ